jgi:hypothetical protein
MVMAVELIVVGNAATGVEDNFPPAVQLGAAGNGVLNVTTHDVVEAVEPTVIVPP